MLAKTPLSEWVTRWFLDGDLWAGKNFDSKMILSNSDSVAFIIDVPYSRKSWSDYQHENPSARFIRYSR